MTRDEIAKEFDRFFEFDTDDRSIVTSVSARLFAEKIAALVVAAERERSAFEIAESYRCGWEGGVKAEREACEKACLNVEIFGHTFNADAAPMELAFQIAEATAVDCAAAIRARGKK